MKRILFITIISSLILGFPSSSVYSQADVESAVREVDRPIREEVEKKIRPEPEKPPIEEEEKEEAPTGPAFFVSEITLEGVESFSPEEFDHITEEYEGREVSLSELNVLARKIEKEYLKKGVIAACFVPPQDVKEGRIKFRVVEAKMGDLRIEDHSFFDKAALQRYWTIEEGEVINYDKMSRILQIMNKNPDRRVRATLHAGTRPETTDVLLDARTHFPVHFMGSFDREGAVATGRERWSAGVRDNNFLFVDDILVGGYSWGKDFSAVYAFHRVPITYFGTSVMYGYSYSESEPKKEYTPFGIKSQSWNTSAFVYQDLFWGADYIGEVYTGLDVKDKRTALMTGVLNKDRLRIARLGGNLIFRAMGGVTYFQPEISQGLTIFGARRKKTSSTDEVPTSREADCTFTKFNLGTTHRRPLWGGVQTALKLKGQLASEVLPPQEQFYMGGIDSVRGYPSGDYLADDAVFASAEILIPAFFVPEGWKVPYGERPLKEDITGVVFYDYGFGRRRGVASTSTEHEEATFESVGLGVRLRLFNQVVVRCEWGFVLGDEPITEHADSRFHISVDIEERLPEEIGKLRERWRQNSDTAVK